MFKEIFDQLLNRKRDSNKYDFGHVLVLGGAPGMVGAPLLCGLGALRIGAGLVTIASSTEVIEKLEKRVLEIMTLRLEGDIEDQTKILLDFISDRRVSVLVAGTGFDKRQVELLKKILKKINIPIILDAGALTCFADNLPALKMIAEKNTQIVATPHAGEFEKLTGIKLSKELPERIEQSKTASDQIKITIVAKGSPTIVVSPDGEVYVNETGNPGLSTAGTGDVLAGIVAGLIAQDIGIANSAKAGSCIHGLAGDLVVEEKTQVGLIASDLLDYIPKALEEIIANNSI